MIRNTWEAMLDLVQSVLGVGHSMIDIVHAGIDDVRNMGDHVEPGSGARVPMTRTMKTGKSRKSRKKTLLSW